MKENKNYRVVRLVLISVALYLGLSAMMLILNIQYEPFNRINLLAEVFVEKQTPNATTSAPTVVEETPEYDFELYNQPALITNFTKRHSCPLPQLAQKLHQLKKTGKGKVRIAYLGDSMIEGDLLTQTLRQLLQKEYGGYGVGFVPINSQVAGFRQTVYTAASGWVDTHFKHNKGNLYLSGHTFTGTGTGSYTDKTILKDSVRVEKSLLFGKIGSANLIANGESMNIVGKKRVNKLRLSNDVSKNVKIKSNTASLPLFGVSFESENGVFVDNFSFRGITGVELNMIDDEILKDLNTENHYDLVVLQYGVNLLFRPKDTDYSYYQKGFSPVLEKLKKALPTTEFLIISTADRAFRYGGEYKSAIGITNLIKTQAQMAYQHKMAFYNQWQTMGGQNSIVQWAKQNPPLANKDYIHPNHKGAEVLAQKLFNAIQNMKCKK